jgi:hypothetical protein
MAANRWYLAELSRITASASSGPAIVMAGSCWASARRRGPLRSRPVASATSHSLKAPANDFHRPAGGARLRGPVAIRVSDTGVPHPPAPSRPSRQRQQRQDAVPSGFADDLAVGERDLDSRTKVVRSLATRLHAMASTNP